MRCIALDYQFGVHASSQSRLAIWHTSFYLSRYLGVVKSISNTVANVSGFIVPVITGTLTSHVSVV